jgi:hypothetical protein
MGSSNRCLALSLSHDTESNTWQALKAFPVDVEPIPKPVDAEQALILARVCVRDAGHDDDESLRREAFVANACPFLTFNNERGQRRMTPARSLLM